MLERFKGIVLLESTGIHKSNVFSIRITDSKLNTAITDTDLRKFIQNGINTVISELMTINYGRKHFDRVLIFRPHNVYGPDMGWEHVIPQFVLRMRELCKSNKNSKIRFPIQGTGKETRAFVFIDDFIDGLMLVLEKGENMNIYHIGTMEEISIGQVTNEIGRYFEKKVTIVSGKRAKGSTPRRCPDITKLEKLGYKPKIPFKEGLKITAEWYDKNSNKIKKIQDGRYD